MSALSSETISLTAPSSAGISPKPRRRRLLSPALPLALLGLALFVGCWYLTVDVLALPRFRGIPGPIEVIREWVSADPAYGTSIFTLSYYAHIWASVRRVTIAFTFDALNVKPAAYLNQSIELSTSSFQNHTIDAAIIWEPTASKLVNAGLAKRVASGALTDQHDGGFLVMDKEFTDKHPDVAKSWLKAELDAQRFLADPANADEIVRIAQSQTEGFSAADLRDALYRKWPVDQGGNADGIRLRLPFVPTGDSADLIKTASEFLYRIKAIPAAALPDGAVQPDTASTVLRDAGVNAAAGVGFVRAQ